MDSNQRQRGNNEIHIHHRHVPGCHSAKMSFEGHVDSGVQAHRRPLSNHQSKVFHRHPQKVCIIGTMSQCTASTASLSDSEFGGDSTDVRRVHLAGEGESLELISYTSASLLEDEYWRLNSSVSMNDDKSSGTGSTRMSTPTYYRPIDSFEERISSISSAASSSPSHLHPRAVSARTTCSHSDEMSAVTFSYTFSEDGHFTSRPTHQHTKPTRSPQRKINKTMCWTDDDSELRRMESITHSFQRSSSLTSRNHKISAPTLPGIGVDVCRSASYQQDHIPTPREAASVSCTLSSIIGELLGVAQQRGVMNSSRNGLLSGFVSISLSNSMHVCTAFESHQFHSSAVHTMHTPRIEGEVNTTPTIGPLMPTAMLRKADAHLMMTMRANAFMATMSGMLGTLKVTAIDLLDRQRAGVVVQKLMNRPQALAGANVQLGTTNALNVIEISRIRLMFDACHIESS